MIPPARDTAFFEAKSVDYGPKLIWRLEWNLFKMRRRAQEGHEVSKEIITSWGIPC
jgi:hypothetical protein